MPRLYVFRSSLPVEFVKFEGRLIDDQVALNWQTALEYDNDYFTIERSKDGINFEKIGQLPGKGDATFDQFYEFIDPAPNYGTNYYRLSQTDLDGSFEVFDRIIPVDYFASETVHIHPNPVSNDQVKLIYQSPEKGDLSVEIFNAAGQKVQEIKLEAAAARNVFDIQLDQLSKGVYIVKTSVGNRQQSTRLVKTN